MGHEISYTSGLRAYTCIIMLTLCVLTITLLAAQAEQLPTEERAVEAEADEEDVDLGVREDGRSIDQIIINAGNASAGAAFSMDKYDEDDGTIIIQGDIRISPEELLSRKTGGNNWSNNVVPYEISPVFSH